MLFLSLIYVVSESDKQDLYQKGGGGGGSCRDELSKKIVFCQITSMISCVKHACIYLEKKGEISKEHHLACIFFQSKLKILALQKEVNFT